MSKLNFFNFVQHLNMIMHLVFIRCKNEYISYVAVIFLQNKAFSAFCKISKIALFINN